MRRDIKHKPSCRCWLCEILIKCGKKRARIAALSGGGKEVRRFALIICFVLSIACAYKYGRKVERAAWQEAVYVQRC